jgi:hypothetical protein
LIESLEPRQMLSAMGFGAVIRPAHRNVHFSSPAYLVPVAAQSLSVAPQSSGDVMPPGLPFTRFGAYFDLAQAHVTLNNSGYNAVDASDSVQFSGDIGTAQLPVIFSRSTGAQASLVRNTAEGPETLFVVIDWGDGSPQTLGTFQSSGAAYTFGGTHTWTAPGDYRLTAFLMVNGPGANLPYVLSAAAGVAHVESTPESTLPPVVLHLPLYDPRNYVPPAFPQIHLPTATPTDASGFSKIYDFVAA